MIIWSGWGLVVLVFGAIGAGASLFVEHIFPIENNLFDVAIACFVGAILCNGFGMLVGRNGGSLFFIPTVAWGWIAYTACVLISARLIILGH